MDLISPNLNLPYLAPAQAQKHVTHNEALRQLDAIVQLSVTSISNMVPVAPENGVRVIVGGEPEGLFVDKVNNIAAYQDGAWAYFVPKRGWRAYVEAETELYIFDGTVWGPIATQNPSETANLFGINGVADLTNRLTVKSPASLFDNNGEGHHLKINKSTAGETAGVLFQTQYVSRAEIGLAGDEKLHLKVSLDGANFKDCLIANPISGSLSFPSGTNLEKMGSPVQDSGGILYHYGVPSVSVMYDGRQNLSLVEGRVYFCPIYVDRPTKIVGGFVAQYNASSTAGALMRAGIYKLGQSSGANWDIGERAADFGTLPADIAGHKDFETPMPSILEAGWYACTVGVSGAGAIVRNVKTLQSGQSNLIKTGVGVGADLRFSGAASHLYANNSADQIVNGFSETWPINPVLDLQTVQPYGYLPFIPKWEAWG